MGLGFRTPAPHKKEKKHALEEVPKRAVMMSFGFTL